MKTHHSLPRIGLLGATALLLSACNLFDSGPSGNSGVSGTNSAWVGKSVDSLTDVSGLAYRDGILYAGNRHASEPGVAAVDVSTGIITAYYPQLLPPTSLAFTADGHVVVTETDYVEGGVSVIDPVAGRIRQSVGSIGSDPSVAAADGRVYLLDRSIGVVTGFEGNRPGRNITLDVQAGPNSNPYGVAIAGGKAWIPRYNSTHLLIVDPDAIDGGARDSIDLSAYSRDSSTNVPRMSLVAAHGGNVFVALQRLDHQWQANDTSLVLVIDAATRTITDTIPLNFRNPIAASVHDGVWYIAGVAGYGDLEGGVEKIDLATRTHTGDLATEESFGGDMSSYVATGVDQGYAVILTGTWPDIRYLVKPVASPASEALAKYAVR